MMCQVGSFSTNPVVFSLSSPSSINVQATPNLKVKRRKMPHDDGGRDWGDGPASPGMPVISGHHQKPGEGPGTDFPSEPPEEAHCADILILDF